MDTTSSFTLGKTPVDRSQVDAALIARMTAGAGNIQVEGNVPQEHWDALADRVTKNDAVSSEDLKQLQDLGKACFKHHKALHGAYRQSGYKDPKVGAELADVHVFQSGNDQIKAALGMANARSAVAALAGASFGPVALVTNYAAYARLDEKSLAPLIQELQAIRDGTSATTLADNQVQGFHREELWPQMVHMLDEGIQSARQGKPAEINAQYYELTNQQIVGKLAEAAEAGCKVRVNVDAGRLVAFKGTRVEIDEIPDKLRSLLQLASAKGDVGVSVYPVPELLGEPGDLMHRKGLRVGDRFLLAGMNANEGSGENVDAGYLIEGPAARRLGQNFARDVGQSAGATREQVYGKDVLAGFGQADINMGARGLVALFDCQNGPSPAGTFLPRVHTFKELDALARSFDQKVSDYVDLPPARIDEMLAAGEKLPLSPQGKEKFLALVDRTLDVTRSPENMARLQDITPPAGKPVGHTTVAVADVPSEREAVMLTAIQEAEKFVYVPAFVMTRSVASMLVARRDELKAQGKDLDIRVLVDPGIYPDGGTPNEAGVEFLEDAGVAVRWANLVRGGQHDVKIHAKEILTDKGEFFGSTNFSNKGLRENWEHSGYVRFDPGDPQSLKQRDHAQAQFLDLWNTRSFEFNSLEQGKRLCSRHRDEKDYLQQADEARYGVVRKTIEALEVAEKDSGAFVLAQAANPTTKARVEALKQEGYDDDTARAMAVREKMGDAAFDAAIAQLPGSQALDQLKSGRRPPRPPSTSQR